VRGGNAMPKARPPGDCGANVGYASGSHPIAAPYVPTSLVPGAAGSGKTKALI
jgi:hypothetical protein